MVAILLADDHGLVRETIAAYIEQNGAFEVIAVPGLDEAMIELAKPRTFGLVLLDYRMPGMEALDGLRRVRETVPEVPVALISGSASPEVARQSLEMGASGFLSKTLTPVELISAVQGLIDGEVFAPDALSGADPHGLTPREVEVVRGIAGGKSNKEIARDLGVQEVTIKLHVKTLSRKLEARNRTHAAMRARDLGLV